MKRYRLKKDLPTFNAGDTFILDDDGCLYLENKEGSKHWARRVMAYHRITLEHFSNILEDWFEEIDEEAELKKRLESIESKVSFLEAQYERLKQTE